MAFGPALQAQTRRACRTPGGQAALVAALLASGCIIDGDHRCDVNQVVVAANALGGETCACAPDAVPEERGYGCILCGANETAMNAKCVCREGYTRPADNQACEESSIGTPCTGADSCQDPFPYCASDGAEGYCTAQGCTATSCPTGYTCEQASDAAYCGKLPAGLGKACTSDADCADGAAKSCDTFMSHTCILTGCASGELTCPGSYACCDVSAILPGFSVCIPPVALTADGNCTVGTKVTP
jgi:hypothetical protein